MTKGAYLVEVRRRFEALSPNAQEWAALRGLSRAMFAWDVLTLLELDRLLGATVVATLLAECS